MVSTNYVKPKYTCSAYGPDYVPFMFEEENNMKYTIKIYDTTYNDEKYIEINTKSRHDFEAIIDLMTKLHKKFEVKTEDV